MAFSVFSKNEQGLASEIIPGEQMSRWAGTVATFRAKNEGLDGDKTVQGRIVDLQIDPADTRYVLISVRRGSFSSESSGRAVSKWTEVFGQAPTVFRSGPFDQVNHLWVDQQLPAVDGQEPVAPVQQDNQLPVRSYLSSADTAYGLVIYWHWGQ